MKLAFDIGAYIGDSIDMIRNLGYDKIICIEPTPSSCEKIIRNYDVEVLCKAVSDKNDKSLKFYCSKTRYGYLNTTNIDWINKTRHNTFINGNNFEEITTKTITLDKLIEIYGIPEYIKIDVEGHELNVLKGLSKKIDLLSFEFLSEKLDESIKCLDRCYQLGYRDFYLAYQEMLPIFIKDESHKITYPYTKLDLLYEQKFDIINIKESLRTIKDIDYRNNIFGNIWCK